MVDNPILQKLLEEMVNACHDAWYNTRSPNNYIPLSDDLLPAAKLAHERITALKSIISRYDFVMSERYLSHDYRGMWDIWNKIRDDLTKL